jgi:hypothetical protein
MNWRQLKLSGGVLRALYQGSPHFPALGSFIWK